MNSQINTISELEQLGSQPIPIINTGGNNQHRWKKNNKPFKPVPARLSPNHHQSFHDNHNHAYSNHVQHTSHGNHLSDTPVANRYCFNCGQYGHFYKKCTEPMTSYGLILYYIENENGDKSEKKQIKYLMIQRDFTPEYKEIINNVKYSLDHEEYLISLIHYLTQIEIKYLRECSYTDLHHQLNRHYFLKKTPRYHRNLQYAAQKHDKLIQGSYNRDGRWVKFDDILEQENNTDNSNNAENNEHHHPLEPDWGFAKGRRHKQQYESDIDCAKRETFEETEISPESYEILPDLQEEEVFKGTNHRDYRHVYYFAKCSGYIPVFLNPFNRPQMSEIRKVGWYTYEECMKLIRPYHVEKRELLKRVHQRLKAES